MKLEATESIPVINSLQIENPSFSEISSITHDYDSQEKTTNAEVQENLSTSNESFEKFSENIERPEIISDLEVTTKIADYLESVDELKFENWCKLSLKEKSILLNKIENRIANIEHRPAVRVELEQMKPNIFGYQNATSNKIGLNSLYVDSNNPSMHREVIDTIIHEGRHAYQHYNVDVKLIHESGAEVASWSENFYNPEYKYYQRTGQNIIIPFKDGTLHDIDFRLYYYQPVEIDARNFAKDILTRLESKGLVCKSEESQLEKNEDASSHNSQENYQVNLTEEEIKNCQFIIKLGDIEKTDPLDKIQGHVSGFHVIDWNDTETLKPIEIDRNITVLKDHLTNKLYICDSSGYKAELHRTTPQQERSTGFLYTYEDFGNNTIGLKDIRTFHPSDKELGAAINELQIYGFSESQAKDMLAHDSDKAIALISKYKEADASLDDLKQLVSEDFMNFKEINAGNSISFSGRLEDERSSEASKFQVELRNAGVYPGSFYIDRTMGGFDEATTKRIKDEINSSRCKSMITDYTYQQLMSHLKKASYYA